MGIRDGEGMHPHERATGGNTPGDSDESLLRSVATGSDSALAQLMDRYGERLFGFAVRLLGCPQDAEEVVSDTFVAAWRGAGKFRRECSVRAWLYSICRNLVTDRLRRRKNVSTCPLYHTVGDPSPASDPEHHAWTGWRRQQVASCIRRLPSAARQTLVLRIYGDLTYEEIAQVCNCPVGTVRSRLNYAMTRLGELLDAENVDNCLEEDQL